jgi:hypothetical protein
MRKCRPRDNEGRNCAAQLGEQEDRQSVGLDSVGNAEAAP